MGQPRAGNSPERTKNPDGGLRPFYLTRNFKYLGNDRFELTIINTADPYGKARVARIYLRGHMLWKGDHPIAAGAQKVDFVADEDYEVTRLPSLSPTCSTGSPGPDIPSGKSTSRRRCSARRLRLSAWPKDAISWNTTSWYLDRGMLFWGARNIDGRGFDKEENRPTNLQIPLVPKVAGR